jgi:heme exporter protein A
MSALAVEATGLGRRYGRRWALIEVGLRVPRGSVVMVSGRNGSGKSTLLRVLASAIRPTQGSALVEGFDLVEARDEVRRKTALLGHASYTYDALTALENLRITARFLGRSGEREALRAALAGVGLADRADDAVETFSAGMRRRLALARVLMQDAAVVLLDEPYGQLDPPGFRLVDRLLGRLREGGRTVLMATHLLERGADLCDQGVILEAGRLFWTGSAADLPAQAAAGLAEGPGA